MLIALIPALVVLLFLSIYPLVGVIQLSLQNRSLIHPDSGQFIGARNYAKLFSDRRFWNALKVTLVWELLTVSGSMLLGILVGSLLYKNVWGFTKKILTLLFIMPAVLPRVAAAYQWRFMYSPLLGIFNYLLGTIGIQPVEFLANRSLALASIAFIDIWQWGLLLSVVILGVLDSVPDETIEAAMLDGANRFRLHWNVTLPIIGPSLVSLLFLKTIESLRTFDLIYVLTKGGPGIATETLDLYAYNTGLALSGRISYGASMSFIMLLITLVFSNVLWRMLKRAS